MAEVADATSTTDTTAADAAVAASTEATKEAPPVDAKTTTLTGEAKPADTTETAKPTEVVYDLKLPENSVLDSTALERTTAIARDLGLSNEAAQKSLEFLNTEVAARESAYLESIKPGGTDWTTRVNEWEAKALKDIEIGGTPEKLQESVTLAKGVLADFADPEVTAWLHETGFGSHPMVLRMLAKVAKATSEGTVLPTGSQMSGDPEADRLRKSYTHPDNYKESTT